MRDCRRLIVMACAALAGSLFAQPAPVKAVHEGVAVEFDLASTTEGAAPRVVAGNEMRFRFRVSDTATGNPLPGLRPAAWIDLRRTARGGISGDTPDCTNKVASFLSGSVLSVPSADLNAWYVLAMNEDASIAVVNPRFGFGGSKLLARVVLDSPGEDWVLTENQKHLFVTMPGSGKVAVVDATSWKVIARLDIPSRPEHVALQPDERNVWVSHQKGVAVFDRETLKTAASISIPVGPHELAFSTDSRVAFITNRVGGSVTVIDLATLRKIVDVPLGAQPSSIAFSTQSRLAYVASDEGIVAINLRGEIVARMKADTGIRQIRATPNGRFLFAVNPHKDQLHIIDASSNRISQTGVIRGGPDQVTFTSTLAYIRRQSDANVLMVPLDQIGVADAPLPLVDFTGGHLPFSKGKLPSPADSIVPVPGSNAVLVANPADRAVYYYQEGMAAPMGQFHNYSHEPRAVMVVDRGLEEGPRGVYQTSARAPHAGTYDVAFFLDSPRVIHCFELKVAADGEVTRTARDVVVVTPTGKVFKSGEVSPVHFQILDAETRKPIAGVRDLRALVFLQPGIWQTRQPAVETDPGNYEFQFNPPSNGIYQAYFDSPSLGLKFNSPHSLTLAAGGLLPIAP